MQQDFAGFPRRGLALGAYGLGLGARVCQKYRSGPGRRDDKTISSEVWQEVLVFIAKFIFAHFANCDHEMDLKTAQTDLRMW